LHKYKQWINVVDDVIQWPHPEIRKVENSLYTCPEVRKWVIPTLKDKFFMTHLMVFKEKLIFWEEILGNKTSFMPPIEVAKRCVLLGPEFPKYIKDCIEDSLRSNTGLGDELLYEESDPEAWGHDYFFSPRDCLNFRLPDTQEDIKRLLVKPPPVDPKFLDRLDQEFRNFIKPPSHRVDLDDLDYLGLFTEKSSFTPLDTKRRKSNYCARIGKKVNPAKQLEFDYCFVQKNASEGRAAVVGTPETLLLIKKFHKMFKAVAHCPEDHYSDPLVTKGLEKWLSAESTREGFIMSDIKKSGLTFNRTVFNRLIAILHELMPTWGWDYFKDYGNAVIHLPNDSKPRPILNGFGLGMLDCVISFTQACIYNILIEDHDTRAYRLDAKFWSDDSIIKARMNLNLELDLDGLDELMQIFNGLLSKCGIVVHEKKPYVSRLGVFLESYGTPYKCSWDSLKRGQYLGCLFDVLKASDIYRAKEIFATLLLDVPKELTTWISTVQDVIISYWGYEFHPEESTMPFEAGGWSYCVEDGWNTFLHTMQELEDTPLTAKFTGLCNTHKPARRFLKLHKQHEEYIQNILDLGWKDDPTAHSWSVIAGATLKQDYKLARDLPLIEKKILDKRQQQWKKMNQPKQHLTEYGQLLKFWDDIKGIGWYLPPRFRLKKREFPTPGRLTKGPKANPTKISRDRAWLYLTRIKGSNLKIIDPFEEFSSYQDVCSKLLTSLSGGVHRSIDEVAFAILNNYDLEELYLKLKEKFGEMTIIDISPELDQVKEIINEAMTSTKGHYVYPLPGTSYSILTDLEENSPLLRYPELDGTAVALLLGNKDLNLTSWEFPIEARFYAQDIKTSYAKYVLEATIKKPAKQIPEEAEELTPEALENLSYYREMIKGAVAHLALGFGDHSNISEEILSIDGPSTSAFDDEDFDMGGMFD